jgi:hypothetical protein
MIPYHELLVEVSGCMELIRKEKLSPGECIYGIEVYIIYDTPLILPSDFLKSHLIPVHSYYIIPSTHL